MREKMTRPPGRPCSRSHASRSALRVPSSDGKGKNRPSTWESCIPRTIAPAARASTRICVMASDAIPFRFLLRVRYGEVDAQKVVFNARWGDYVDLAVTEYQ